MEPSLTRRTLISGAASLGMTAGLNTTSTAAETAIHVPPTAAKSYLGNHKPQPLPFDPAKLDGLSARLRQSFGKWRWGWQAGRVRQCCRSTSTPEPCITAGHKTTTPASLEKCLCWSATCTNKPMQWTMAQRHPDTLVLSCATSTGSRSTVASRSLGKQPAY